MLLNKKLTVGLAIIALIGFSIAASRPPEDAPKRNLKVLPKNISHDDLEKVMHEFNNSLGVKCNFCHASQKDNPQKLDFPSDEKPEKNIARSMYKMTGRINKKFFKYKESTDKPVPPVGCITCHNGQPHPESKPQPRQQGQQAPTPGQQQGGVKPPGNN
jgi:hypothetical protein